MKRKLGLALVGTMVAIILSAVFKPYWLALEGSFIDWRLKLKESSRLSKKIKIFEIEGKSFLTNQLVVNELIKQNVKTISIYIPEDEFKENWEWLKEIPKSKLVISAGGRIIERLDESIHNSDSLAKANGIVEVSSLVSFLSSGKKDTLEGVPTLENKYFAHSNTYADAFGKLRKIPLWLESGQRLVPAFAIRSWFHYLKVNDPKIKLLSSRMELKDKGVDLSVPTDMNSMAMVEMPEEFEDTIIQLKGGEKLIIETISKADVKDKLAFIGLFSHGKRLEDKKAFRFQIAFTNSLLKKSFLKEAHKSTVHSLSLVLSIVALVFCGMSKGLKGYLGIILLTLFYLMINVVSFNAGLILPILSPILAMAFSVFADRRFKSMEAI